MNIIPHTLKYVATYHWITWLFYVMTILASYVLEIVMVLTTIEIG